MTKPLILEYKGYNGTIDEIIEKFNLNLKHNTVIGRLHRGCSVEESFQEKHQSKSPNAKIYKSDYDNFKGPVGELYKHFKNDKKINISFEAFKSRLNNGWSVKKSRKPF